MKQYLVGSVYHGGKVRYSLEACIENPGFIKDSRCLADFESEIRSKSISDGQVKVETIKLIREK